ncbi:DUF1836 domain-containing protein [Rossellomorea sp. AcN35-11]|nr:DUF1836 domain-containing protein [Rossellomorea aquimaris]WJV29553.1 DUF1836 domain-containing protein [Rossellomorea sp. AcN35-11]
MDMFNLTRSHMAELLLALNGTRTHTPAMILQDAWTAFDPDRDFSEEDMPPVVQKILTTTKKEIGFSLNEIVSLGNLIEFTNFPQSTVQNWVKRDVKVLIGSPMFGKKYTIEQAAMLFIVEDLKATLDFESIRNILTLVFNNIEDRTDDIVNPTDLYAAYSSIFDKIHHQSLPGMKTSIPGSVNEAIDQFIQGECREVLPTFNGVKEDNLNKVLHVLVVSVLTVQSAFYQAATKKYVDQALQLQDT